MVGFKQLETLNKCLVDWNVNYSVYPYNGYTVNEVLMQFHDAINNGIITINEYTNLISAVMEWLKKEGLKEEVEKSIDKMYQDGSLGALINERLLHDLNEKIKNIEDDVTDITLNLKKYDVFTDGKLDGVKITELFKENDNKTFYLPNGTYDLRSTIYIVNNVNMIFSPQTIIRAINPMDDMININKESTDGGKNRYIKDGILEGNGLAKNCIHIAITSNLWIDGVRFKNPINRGLKIDAGYEILGTNLFFTNTINTNINDNVAIDLNTSDCMFSNITMKNFTVGMLITQGGNFISKIHPWCNQIDRLSKTIGIDNRADANFFDMVYFDTCNIGMLTDHYASLVNCIFNIHRSYRKHFSAEPIYVKNTSTKIITLTNSSFEYTNNPNESYSVLVTNNNDNTIFVNCEFPTPSTLKNTPKYFDRNLKVYKIRIDFTELGTINANDRKDVEKMLEGMPFTIDYRDTVIFNHGNFEIGLIPYFYTKNNVIGMRVMNVTNNPIVVSNKALYVTIIKNTDNGFLPY